MKDETITVQLYPGELQHLVRLYIDELGKFTAEPSFVNDIINPHTARIQELMVYLNAYRDRT